MWIYTFVGPKKFVDRSRRKYFWPAYPTDVPPCNEEQAAGREAEYHRERGKEVVRSFNQSAHCTVAAAGLVIPPFCQF